MFREVLPASLHRSLKRRWRELDRATIGRVSAFLALHRPEPYRRAFGAGAGKCVDRHYIEAFLAENAADIRGTVLEVADDKYTRRFGGDRVTRSEVLHAQPGNPRATIVGDLTRPDGLPTAAFDCIILTQTLQFIFDLPTAVRTLSGMLRPGGVVLATVPGISQISRYDMDRWGDFWRFTNLSARRLFEEAFPAEAVSVGTHGNVFAAVAFLHGVVVEEVDRADLEPSDPDYQLVLTVRARKPLAADRPSPTIDAVMAPDPRS